MSGSSKTEDSGGVVRVIYSGEDEAYLKVLEERFKREYSSTEFEFCTIFDRDPTLYQRKFIEIIKSEPTIVYIDFSVNHTTQMKMATLLKRLNTFNQIPVIGLVHSKDFLKQCWSSGVDITHIKCGEYGDVISNAWAIAFPDRPSNSNFALAKLNEPIDFVNDFRVGYMTPEFVHCEGNMKLEVGETIELRTEIPKKLILSNKYIVKNIYETNLYYDYNYSYDLAYTYADKPVFDESEMNEALKIEDLKARESEILRINNFQRNSLDEYEMLFNNSKKKIKEWIQFNKSDSAPKITKVLIIDKSMKVLESERKPLDQYPYTIRCQTQLSSDLLEVDSIRPNLVAFNFIPKLDIIDQLGLQGKSEYTAEEDELLATAMKENEVASMEQLGLLCQRVKSVEGYTPFIVLFNCPKFNSKSLQDTFDYPLIIANPNVMDIHVIIGLADLYEKKQDMKKATLINKKIDELKSKDPKKYGNITESFFDEDKYYIGKSNELSHASYKSQINIRELSEGECAFNCDREIGANNFRLKYPIKMAIKVITNEKGELFTVEDGKNLYRALIHSTDEDDKKEIRKSVNDIFFSELNQERQSEKDAFSELNDQALQKKNEQLKEQEEFEGSEDSNGSADSPSEEPSSDSQSKDLENN